MERHAHCGPVQFGRDVGGLRGFLSHGANETETDHRSTSAATTATTTRERLFVHVVG